MTIPSQFFQIQQLSQKNSLDLAFYFTAKFSFVLSDFGNPQYPKVADFYEETDDFLDTCTGG